MNQYHHGNLREALLQEGLKHLTKTGNRNISLREMAKRCGVSSAAPYAHFKTKDQFLLAIEYYMLEKLALELRATQAKYLESPDILNELGLCYVHFFLVNPNYYSVLFSDCIHAESAIWKDTGKSNPAFKVLEETASKTLADLNLPKEERHNLILAMWTLVHGMAVIVSMPNVSERLKKEGNVKEKLRRILTAFR